MSNQGLPRLRFLKKVTAALAAVGTVVLLSGAGALASAPLANAGESSPPALSVTCEAVSVNLHGYAAEVPATDAIPGNPGQPGIDPTYQTVVVTPAIPAIPAVPATYVQEWLYVQHETGNLKWMPEGWNGIVHGVDNGEGWHYVQPEQHRDTETILTPAIFAVPAIPAVTEQVMTNPGQPYIAPTPGIPAMPAKVNTVKLTIDGVSVIDTSFGTDFTSTKLVNPITPHNLHLQVTGWDGVGTIDRWGQADSCVGPINVITLPQPVVTQATGVCDGGEFKVTPASVELVSSEHYTWSNYGQDEHGVIHDVAAGTYTYTAMPIWGYGLDSTTVTTTVAELVSNECPPSVTTTNTVPPADNTPTAIKAAVVIPQGTTTPSKIAVQAASNDKLAATGATVDPAVALAVAAALLLTGLVLVCVRAQRRPRH